jgi:hypothetical protein
LCIDILASNHSRAEGRKMMARSHRPSSIRSREIGESSSDNDKEPEMRYLCTACQHAPLSSTKALHVHRTRHQLRADVTLPDGTSEIITRPSEAASWSCPEHACQNASDQLLRLRAHLRYRHQKRRSQIGCRALPKLGVGALADDLLNGAH